MRHAQIWKYRPNCRLSRNLVDIIWKEGRKQKRQLISGIKHCVLVVSECFISLILEEEGTTIL